MAAGHTQTSSTGEARTQRARRHIFASFGLKGVSMLTGFVAVPLYLEYLTEAQYGVWLTLISVIAWFGFFDLGLGNGLRNKFAEAKAKNQTTLAAEYVSTTYGVLAVISGILLVLFGVVWPFVDWAAVFKVPENELANMAMVVLVVFGFFCIQFVIQLVKMVLLADQRPSWSNGINTIGSVLSLGAVAILYQTTEGNIFYLAISISVINLTVPLLASLILFSGRYRAYRPKLRHINWSHSKALFGLGLQFFVMNIAALVVFMTDNMIITQLLGPEEVPPYAIAFKYFGIVTMGFTIITAPYWSAFTDAWHRGDLPWIRKTTKRIVYLSLLALAGVGVLLAIAPFAYDLWVGDKIQVPFLLSAFMAVWVALSTATMIFSNFLSGVGKIRISLYHAIFVSIANIPLSIWFARDLELGSAGVILASCLCVFPRAILQPIQYFKIVKGKAQGIWNQ